MKRLWLRIAVFLAIIVGLFLVFRLTPLRGIINIEEIFRKKNELHALVQSRYLVSVLLFLGVYIVVTASSIPGAAVLSILGGFLFGPFLSPIYADLAATAGATVVFLVTRYFLGNAVQQRYADRLARMNRELERDGSNYMLTLRLVPAFPFFLINILAGLTPIKLRTFVWTSIVGMLPGSFVFAYLGYAGGSLDSFSLSPQIILAFSLLGVFSLVPVIVRKLRSRTEILSAKTNGEKNEK